MNNIDEIILQSSNIKYALEGVISSLHDLNCKADELERLNVIIATVEAGKCLAEQTADHLEKLEV
ncbi:hypothetical protein IGK74_000557 [Enterococcus sp. AZ150]|uniref:hypothetical protein n=1 Tax=Enterococcus sp. AZ150 TaxID=2774866 RepID=UPI003F2723F3